MKLIYLAHPYGGKAENAMKSVVLEYKLIEKNASCHIFNAVKYFMTYKGFKSEKQIMAICLDMVTRCDELWVAPGWKDSPGCGKEIEEATKNGIRARYLTEVGIEDSVFPIQSLEERD